MKLLKNKPLILVIWMISTYVITAASLVYLISRNQKSQDIAYSVFEAKPPVTITSEDSLSGEDTRAAVIDQYFAKHKCPMAGTGEIMVAAADKYGFEYWWLPAIAWQESTCGKAMPNNSYNAWGYGIYGTKVTRFTSWEEAVDTIARDLSKNFFAKGLIEPCDVMKRYTPPSNGSWCKGINYFKDEMLGYKSPEKGSRQEKNVREYLLSKDDLEDQKETTQSQESSE